MEDAGYVSVMDLEGPAAFATKASEGIGQSTLRTTAKFGVAIAGMGLILAMYFRNNQSDSDD